MKNTSFAPDISVIVPAYNVEKYICRCLDSLLNQDFTGSYEIIVVNDGSTDKTQEILASYSNGCEYIKVITKPNGGLSSARNAAIEVACGEFIAFVDSDDFVEQNYLSAMYGAAMENDADMVVCNYRNTDEDGEGVIDNIFVHPVGVYDSITVLRETIMDINIRSYVWNKLYRRSLFIYNNIRFPLGMKFEDFAVMPQLMYYSRKVAFIKDTLYNYVHRKDSITGGMKKSAVQDYVKGYCMLRSFLEGKNIFKRNRFTYYLLRKKVSVTALGMLYRCYFADPKNTHLIANYSKIRKCLKMHSGNKYYYTSTNKLESSRVLI